MFAIAPTTSDGRAFPHCKLNGIARASGQTAPMTSEMDGGHLAVIVYADIPGDYEDDGDTDFEDTAAFQRCFSGDIGDPRFQAPPAECLAAFDVEVPADGDVDLLDFAESAGARTGPF